jgi:hypothetical protein
MIGAAYADSYSGAVYVVYGPGTGANDLGDAPVKITGPSYTYLSGWGNGTLTGVPDMNGDGADEIAIGHSYGSSYSGAVYLFYGAALSGDYTTSDADVTYTSSGSYDYDMGYQVGRATDFNGDGLGDVMMGAYASSTGGSYSGSVFIVAGPGDTGGNVDSIAQVELYGETYSQYVGQNGIDGEMDINRDGFTDVVVGAPYYTASAAVYSSGVAYVMYGPQTGDVSLADSRCPPGRCDELRVCRIRRELHRRPVGRRIARSAGWSALWLELRGHRLRRLGRSPLIGCGRLREAAAPESTGSRRLPWRLDGLLWYEFQASFRSLLIGSVCHEPTRRPGCAVPLCV